MSKDIAIDVLRNQIKFIKSLHMPAASADQNGFVRLMSGLQQLSEAYAMVLNDSTKAHASPAFDKAHKTFFDISQDSKVGADFQFLAGACMIFGAAMTWLYFSKPPARPWKP